MSSRKHFLSIRLTHTGLYADGSANSSSVFVSDLDFGFELQTRKVPVYVPAGGYVDLPLTSRSLFSYSQGNIAGFVEEGLLRADLVLIMRDLQDRGGAGTGIFLSPGIPNIQRVANVLELVIENQESSGYIRGECIRITGLSGAYSSLNGSYIIQSVQKRTTLTLADPTKYKISVVSEGPDIPPAMLVGVLIELVWGKVRIELSGSGDAGGVGSDVSLYVGGVGDIVGGVDPTDIQFTPVFPAEAPLWSIFVNKIDSLPYYKDTTGISIPLTGGAPAVSPLDMVLAAGNVTGGTGIIVSSGDALTFEENNTVPGGPPPAGQGKIWVRDDSPNVLVYTDDTGVDHTFLNTTPSWSEVLAAGNSSGGSAAIISTGDPLVFSQNASVPGGAPDPGTGVLWIRNDAPTSLVYTDDAGVDHEISAALSWGDVLSIGNASGGSEVLISPGDPLTLSENAAVPGGVPGAGQGKLWIRDDSPNIPIFTDDTGVDHNLLEIPQLSEVLASGNSTNGSSIVISGGDSLSLAENAAVPGGPPGAGFGKVWVRDDSPTTLIFTDDVGIDHTFLNAVPSWSSVLAEGSTSGGSSVTISAGDPLRFAENAAVPGGAPPAGQGTIWIRNDAPNVIVFTDDGGTDHNLLEIHALSSVLASGNTTNGYDILVSAGDSLTLAENAAVPGGVPAAGQGKVWVRNDAPNVLVFTDDAGSDHVLFGEVAPLADVLSSGNTTSGTGITVSSGDPLTFVEDATVPGGAPAAGQAVLWVRNDSPNVLVFTDDSGVDHTFIDGDPSLADVLLVGNATGGTGITISSGDPLTLSENAAVPGGAPGAGQGTLWVRDDAPNVPIFTDDAGVDHNLLEIPQLSEVLASGNTTGGSGIIFSAGDPLTLSENAAVPGGVPGAGQGKLWVRNDAPNTFVFTDDAGVDHTFLDAVPSWSAVLAVGSVSGGSSVTISGGDPFRLVENAAVPGGAPPAGQGTLWVRNDAPNVLVFTDDTGVDRTFLTSTPPLAQVLAAGNTSGGSNIIMTSGDSIQGVTSSPGGPVTVQGGLGVGATAGGALVLTGGQGGATGSGGAVSLFAGSGGSTSGSGGTTTIRGGDAATSGAGGNLNLSGGNAVGGSNPGGAVSLVGGVSTGAGAGSSVTISPGAVSTGARGRIILSHAGPDSDRLIEMVTAGSNGTSVRDFVGTRNPEGAVLGSTGDLYRRNTGSSGDVYLKASGTATSTGWLRLSGGDIVLDRSFTNFTTAGTSSEFTLYSVTIPANSMGTTGIVRMYASWLFASSSLTASFTIRIKFGGVTVYQDNSPSVTVLSGTRVVIADLTLVNRGATSSQIGSGNLNMSDSGAASVGRGNFGSTDTANATIQFATSPVDTTLAQPFAITIQHSTSSAGTSSVRFMAYATVAKS